MPGRGIKEFGDADWESECHRRRGKLLLRSSDHGQAEAEAEAAYRRAIAVAQSLEAKSWVLRAATSLARLWQGQGKTEQSHDLLARLCQSNSA